MSTCIDLNDIQYTKLQECVQDLDLLQLWVSAFKGTHKRFPRLDEVPFADSSKMLVKNLSLKVTDQNTNYTTVKEILKYTGKETIKEAQETLNTELHPDLETSLYKIGNTVLVLYEKKPVATEAEIIDNPLNMKMLRILLKNLFSDMLYDLADKLGINFKIITNDLLNSADWKGKVSDARGVNAFIYKGEIYVNIDNAKFDAPLHELAHILIGTVRFRDAALYSKLLSLVDNIPGLNLLASLYYRDSEERTLNDILEEVFVSEFAKYLTEQSSVFDSVSPLIIEDILNIITSSLDTMIKGEFSVDSIPDLYKTSITDILKKVKPKRLKTKLASSVDVSYIHRLVNNLKSELLKKGDLIEECS